MKRTGLAAFVTAGVMMLTAGCGSGNSGKTAIEVGDNKITMADVSLFLQDGDGFDASKKQYVELMEDTFKYGALGEAMGIELTDEDKDSILQAKASFAQRAGGLKAYKAYLKDVGSSMDFIEKLMTASQYQQKVTEKIEEEIGDAEPTDEEKKAFFTDNYYRAKHILINLEDESKDSEDDAEPESSEAAETPVADEEGNTGEALANAILKRAQDGENFDEMITKYNQDPGMADQPDGYIFTEGDMVEEFYECTKNLKPGEFGLCKSSYGYHIVQRLPLTADEANFGTWYEDNSSQIESAISQKKIDDKFEELCKENNITSKVNQDVVDGFKAEELVTMPPSNNSGMASY